MIFYKELSKHTKLISFNEKKWFFGHPINKYFSGFNKIDNVSSSSNSDVTSKAIHSGLKFNQELDHTIAQRDKLIACHS